MTELFQELGEGGGGEVVGLVRIATKVIQGFIYLKLNYLSSGAPRPLARGDKSGGALVASSGANYTMCFGFGGVLARGQRRAGVNS